MSAPPFSDPSEETRRWLEQAPARLAALRSALHEQEQLRAAIRAAELENQRLRGALQEQEQLRTAVRAALQDQEQLRAAVQAAEQESQRLRAATQEQEQLRTAVRSAEQESQRLRAAAEQEIQRLRTAFEQESQRLRTALQEQEQLRASGQAAEQDNQRLRGALEQESQRLRAAVEEQTVLRGRLEASERRGQELTNDVNRLRAESQRYREREGPADSLTTVLSELLITLRPQLAIAPAGGPGVLTSRFEQALLYATRLHAQRTRDGGRVPYVAQPLAAAALVLEDGGDEDQAIGALLYDAARADASPATLEEIRQRFGERVALVVQRGLAGGAPTDPWRVRKERLVADLRQAPLDAVRVVAADALHTARVLLTDYRATNDPPWNRLGVAREDIGWYYRALTDVLRTRGLSALAAEMSAVADDLETGPRRAVAPGSTPARRSFFGLIGMASLGGIFVALAILAWVLFQSTVDMWWEFVRPLLHP